MLQPNPAQATGAMTLEQGVASMKAKLTEKGANAEDTAIVHAEDPNEQEVVDEFGGEAVEEVDPTDGQETDTETVSEDNQEGQAEIPLSGKISMPDGSTITAEEARKGYLRQSDYTRKTQDLAKDRETLHANFNNGIKELAGLYQQLASLQEAEPTPAQMFQLRQQDPAKYEDVKAYWEYRRPILAQAQRKIAEQEVNNLKVGYAKAFETLSAGEFEPKWKDQKVLKSDLDKLATYMVEERGLDPEGVARITDPTVLIMAEESRRYRELQKAKPKAALAVKGKPLPFKPGAKSTATPQSETIRVLQEAFTKNPSVDNAVALQKAKATQRR